MTTRSSPISAAFEEFESLAIRIPALAPVVPTLESLGALIAEVFRGGGRLYACGNGGSACDCEHLVGELVKAFRLPRPCPQGVSDRLADPGLARRLQGGLPAVSLVSQAAAISAIANDQGADLVYAQQLLALGSAGDVLVGFSTSGSAANVRAAFQVARALEMHAVLFTGSRCPQETRDSVDVALVVPAEETAAVQEYHLACYHALCSGLERLFFG
jgi:D-sedoheptulose 7-phosphate isomerase